MPVPFVREETEIAIPRLEYLKTYFSFFVLRPYNWPTLLNYIPLYFYFAWLLFKYRGLKFLYCNPCLPYGGILDDSKTSIYAKFHDSEFLLPTALISEKLGFEQRVQRLDEFLQSNQVNYPVVLKPDRGYGSKGVKIVDSRSEAKSYLARAQFDIEVQGFCDFDNELLVFFYRDPKTRECQVFSMGHKTPPIICGDGHSTIEELVGSDPHLCLFKEKLMRTAPVDRSTVLENGRCLRLADIFKQSLGSQHQNIDHLLSDELKRWVDRVTSPLEGFYVGRFDIKFRNLESLSHAKDLKIIELNGGSAVATLINKYPSVFLNNYYTIFSTWDLVFRIGDVNSKEMEPIRAKDFFRDLFRLIRKKKKFLTINSL